MKQAYIRYRHQKIDFEVPHQWRVLSFAGFEDHSQKEDPILITRKALRKPVSSAPLKKLLSPDAKIAIIIEDLTRASPKKAVLRALIEVLDEIPVPAGNIKIVIALGTHRELAFKELEETFGAEIVTRYEFINHDCNAPDLVPIGKLKSGCQVKINPVVHRASFKIGIGSIFPHPMNGFGGGGKILFPGVADFESILEHHLKYSFRDGSELGVTNGNPFYEEVTSLSQSGRLDFIINSVLDHNDKLYDIVCGDPAEAHLAGIEICKRIISKKFKKKADLTVITAFPYTEGPQIMKPLAPASMITRKGGCIILFADCTLPLPEAYIAGCEAFREKHGNNLRESVLRLFENNKPIFEDGAPEFNMSMAQALLALNDFNVILVTEDIPEEQVERIGFHFRRDLKEAFDLGESFCPDPEVHFVPSGGVILPVIV